MICAWCGGTVYEQGSFVRGRDGVCYHLFDCWLEMKRMYGYLEQSGWKVFE